MIIYKIKNKLKMPFTNSKGEGDERDTISLVMKIIGVVITLSIVGSLSLMLIDTAKSMQSKEAEIRQQQNESINYQ